MLKITIRLECDGCGESRTVTPGYSQWDGFIWEGEARDLLSEATRLGWLITHVKVCPRCRRSGMWQEETA